MASSCSKQSRHNALADPRGGARDARPPWGSKFFHFHAVFGKKLKNNSTFGSWRPPWGKSWIRHCNGIVYLLTRPQNGFSKTKINHRTDDTMCFSCLINKAVHSTTHGEFFIANTGRYFNVHRGSFRNFCGEEITYSQILWSSYSTSNLFFVASGRDP